MRGAAVEEREPLEVPVPSRFAMPLFAAGLLAGCLSDPTPLDCATAPPGTVGCMTDRGPSDGDVVADGSDDMGGEPDRGVAVDMHTPPADGAAPAVDVGPALDEGVGPDAAPISACAEVVCDEALAARCIDDMVVTFNPVGRCVPPDCVGEPACDPAQLDCAGYAACFFDCILTADRDDADCLDRCRGAASEAGLGRFAAIDACAEESGCDDGNFDCLRARCGEPLAACTGPELYVWFVRRPGADYACDYALAPVEDCSERGLRCRDGRCVEPDCDGSIVGCDGRLVTRCEAGATVTVPCTRDEICVAGACEPPPEAHGQACRAAEDQARCAEAGLVCGGVAAIPMCLLDGAPLAVGDACWTSADCRPGARCTLAGRCSLGEPGDACLDDDDCDATCGGDGRCL